MPDEPLDPPVHLGPKGLALWERMTCKLIFDDHELAVLVLAAEQADVVAALEDLVASEGWVVEGSTGQPRLHPAVAEARQARAAVARLLSAIPVPDGDGPPMTPAQRRAKKAADTRWASHRARTAG